MDLGGWTLPRAARAARRRTGRAHTGLIRREGSNERWCIDTLEVACWNGELVMIGFALDCCDREALAHVAAPRHLTRHDIHELRQRAVATRFSESRPLHPIQWLSDNDGIFTALRAPRLGCALDRVEPSKSRSEPLLVPSRSFGANCNESARGVPE
jgi:transposase InsO family protein